MGAIFLKGCDTLSNINLEQEIKDYLFEHKFASLATCYNNSPYIATIRYSSDGFKLYFSALKTSNKVENILENSQVALTIDDNSIEKFVQYYGKARVLNDEKDIALAIKNLERVYKYVKYWTSEPDVMFFEVEPKKIRITVGPPKKDKRSFFGDILELKF